MGARTDLTSSISLDAVVAWNCSKCETDNVSNAKLLIQCEATVGSSQKKIAEAQQMLHDTLLSEWKPFALGIIKEPEKHAKELQRSLFVADKGRCKKCGHVEIWAKKPWTEALGILAFGVAFISLILFVYGLIHEEFSLVSLLVAIVFGAITGFLIYIDSSSPKKIIALPKRSLPTIVCANRELNEYAISQGKPICTEEAISAVSKDIDDNSLAPDTDTTLANDTDKTSGSFYDNSQSNELSEKSDDLKIFCHKCGYKLVPGSEFCSKCGTKI